VKEFKASCKKMHYRNCSQGELRVCFVELKLFQFWKRAGGKKVCFGGVEGLGNIFGNKITSLDLEI
jgi:hypothetical protein